MLNTNPDSNNAGAPGTNTAPPPGADDTKPAAKSKRKRRASNYALQKVVDGNWHDAGDGFISPKAALAAIDSDGSWRVIRVIVGPVTSELVPQAAKLVLSKPSK